MSSVRACPICGCAPNKLSFPYTTSFNGVIFNYVKCGMCKSVYVDPVPDEFTFSLMYAKTAYHDLHYDDIKEDDYNESAQLLSQVLSPGATVLDYGCGVGGFLKACRSKGLTPVGVEFDSEAALYAEEISKCEVIEVKDFSKYALPSSVDAVHIGDVLEHLPDPAGTLSFLISLLRPGGMMFIEGPLELNPSVVYWASRAFGTIKRVIRPKFLPSGPPHHLFRIGEYQQKRFFAQVDSSLRMFHWQVYETGWPYIGGGVVKRSIAACAILLGGRHFAGATFGNRFKAMLVKPNP